MSTVMNKILVNYYLDFLNLSILDEFSSELFKKLFISSRAFSRFYAVVSTN